MTEPEFKGGIYMYTKDLIEGIGDRAQSTICPFWSTIPDGYDIIHWQHAYGYANDINNFIKKLRELTIPYIVTFHEIPTYRRPIWEPKIFCPIIVGNKIMKDELIKLGVKEDMVNIIPHGSKEWFSYDKDEARKKLNFQTDKKVLVQPGFTSYGKGMLEVIDACSNIPEVYLVFAGSTHPKLVNMDENNLIKCMKLAHARGMTDRVKFTGKYLTEDELNLWCSAADFIILNHQNVYGTLSSSAMAKRILDAGRPLILSDDVRLSEFPDKMCLRVNSTDIEGIRLAIRKLKNDESLCKELGKQAQYYATETLWYNMATKHISLYREILGDI